MYTIISFKCQVWRLSYEDSWCIETVKQTEDCHVLHIRGRWVWNVDLDELHISFTSYMTFSFSHATLDKHHLLLFIWLLYRPHIESWKILFCNSESVSSTKNKLKWQQCLNLITNAYQGPNFLLFKPTTIMKPIIAKVPGKWLRFNLCF